MEPEKKLFKDKKTKLTLIIIAAVVSALIIAGVCVYFFVLKKPEPEVVLTDAQYVIKTGSWEKQDSPTVIWTFRADGTGEVTTNKSNYYNTTWELTEDESAQTLSITTDWLYELNDSFEFALDRETNSFTVKNKSDETESVFVPLGTQADKGTKDAGELEKTEE